MDTNVSELQKALSQARKELAILYEVSSALRTTLELDHILHIILTGVTAHAGLGFNRAILFLVNHHKRVLEGKMMIGPESGEEANRIWKHIESSHKKLDDLVLHYKEHKDMFDSAPNRRIRKVEVPLNMDDGGLLAMSYFNGKPIHVPKEEIGQYTRDPLAGIFQTNELVIMPLKAKDKVNGIIVADNLYTQKPISAEDLRIFEMLANQAGLAIENSQLYEQIVNKSHMDSLTSLWNHGFFQDALSLELEKASQRDGVVSLLMIDIDDFKKLNDTHGHQPGDLILTRLAHILKESSREADFVCRYGGEEFSIILPNTGKDQAYGIAERLRKQIEETNLGIDEKSPIHLTVSIGLASFPLHAQTKEELIVKADKAMYTAKFSGKNNTQIAEINTP